MAYGWALVEAERYPEALGEFQAALRLLSLASTLNTLGRYDESVSAAQQAVTVAPQEAEGHYQLAMGLLNLGKVQDALGPFQEAARLAPGSAAVQFQLGAIFQRKGEFEAAFKAFQTAARLEPANASAWGAMGLTTAQLRRSAEAVVEYWDHAVPLDPNSLSVVQRNGS